MPNTTMEKKSHEFFYRLHSAEQICDSNDLDYVLGKTQQEIELNFNVLGNAMKCISALPIEQRSELSQKGVICDALVYVPEEHVRDVFMLQYDRLRKACLEQDTEALGRYSQGNLDLFCKYLSGYMKMQGTSQSTPKAMQQKMMVSQND